MVKEVCRIPLLYTSGYFSRKYELFQENTKDDFSFETCAGISLKIISSIETKARPDKNSKIVTEWSLLISVICRLRIPILLVEFYFDDRSLSAF